jgi:hypothetical protein
MARLDATLARVGAAVIGQFGDRVTRKRPTDTVVAGETRKTWNNAVPGIRATVREISTRAQEHGWGRQVRGGAEMEVPVSADVVEGDLILVETGRYAGRRYWIRAPRRLPSHSVFLVEYEPEAPDVP